MAEQFGWVKYEVLAGHLATIQASEAVATGELSRCHGDELSPASHLAQCATRMVLIGQRLELMSRNKF